MTEFVTPMREMQMWPAMQAVAHTLAYDGEVVGDSMAGTAPRPEQWASVTIPTLVVDGGQTPWLSAGAGALAAALPRAQRHTISGQPHNVSADAIAPVLRKFFGGPEGQHATDTGKESAR